MPTTARFAELYAQLNPRQREAVDAVDGPVMVIAGPGTGKTKILTLRIANILAKTDIPPEAVLALTFTESGTTEMRARLADIIGVAAYRVTVTTFHAFCNDIIQQYPEAFGDIAGSAPIMDTDQLALIQELIEGATGLELLRPPGAPLLYLKAVSGTISTLKREGVPPARLAAMADHERATLMDAPDLYHEKGVHKGKMKGEYGDRLKHVTKLRELAGLYAHYQTALRARASYDYNDMIMEVARVLTADEQFRLMLQERYQYLLVDEHQDTNNAQNTIIELLASFWEHPNLFVVGDVKQAIYRFQGASLENFLYFKKIYPRVMLIELEDNYRSSQHILDAAHGVRPSAGDGLKARAGRTQEPVRIIELSDPDAERYALARLVAGQLAAGVRPQDIAVLYRDNADGRALATVLDRVGVPYTLASDADAMTDPHLQKLLAILDAVRDYGQAGPLLHALHADVLRVAPLDVYKLSDFCRQGRNPYDAMQSATLAGQAGIQGVARMTDLAAAFARWNTAAHNEPAIEAFETIVRESGVLDAILASERVGEKLAKLHSIYDMARGLVQQHRTYSLLDLVDHLRFVREHGLSIKSAAGTPQPGRVRLLTAHKSKGLEFDHVYLTGVTDDHWGPRGRRELIRLPQAVFLKASVHADQDADDDERNLFYVALTRARNTATITLARRDLEGRDLLPCRYIADIRPELLVRPDTAPYEADWAAHRDIHFAAPVPVTPDIADRDFLRETFLRQGLSATALNNYLSCPWKFFYRNLVRIPEAPVFSLMYGSAVDHALQAYFEALRQGTDKGKEYLVGSFRGFTRHQPFQERQLADAQARGVRALSGYFDRYHDQWHGNVINQLKVPAVPFVLTDGTELTLNGKMDRVDVLDAANRVVVVDYKTGKPKSRRELMGQAKDASGDYLRQLVFYHLLLDHFRDGYYTMTKGVIDFVDPSAAGAYAREEFLITPEQVGELAQTVRRVADEILMFAFWDRTCGDRDCQYCRLRGLMA